MKHTLNTKLSFLLAALLLLLPVRAAAQDRPNTAPKGSPRQVFAELIKPYQNMRDYTVKIQAKVVMPNIRIPDFTAILYFKKPDKFQIKTKNFAPIPRGNAIFNPFQFDPDKNQITFKQMENLDGAPAAVYKVEPGEEEKRIRFYNVWVGGNPKRIVQVESHSFKGTKALIKLTYRQAGQGADKWLLPDKVYAHLTFPEGVNSPENLTVKDSPISSTSAKIEAMTGEGDITISYSEWQVNTGLDDQLFKDK
jgi:outer membrane lipoprotein-sorting protein